MPWQPIDSAIRKVLIDDIAQAGLSNCQLAKNIGGRTEGWLRTFKAGTSAPLTVGDVEAIAQACGKTLAGVLARAREMV